MSVAVVVCAKVLHYPEGGGHFWVYLNWALGLQSAGCRVLWMEEVSPSDDGEEVRRNVELLRTRLAPYGIHDLVIGSDTGEALPAGTTRGCLTPDQVAGTDLLVNIGYARAPNLTRLFRRSALVDIDPGLTQSWIARGMMRLAPHDAYFTIGETVDQPGSRIGGAGLRWLYTPPCVALDRWPVSGSDPSAPFTTVTHWGTWISFVDGETVYRNDKREGFLPYLDLPRQTRQPLELALQLTPADEDDRVLLTQHGWRLRLSYDVAGNPDDYQTYVRGSRGEFSCAKPSCLRQENAWISDRTLCYLASGKPAVVEFTGRSRFLPDDAGLFRFRTMAEAVRHLEAAAGDYERHCRLARALAEEYFDARVVAKSMLERVL